jgi:hypothetical protein
MKLSTISFLFLGLLIAFSRFSVRDWTTITQYSAACCAVVVIFIATLLNKKTKDNNGGKSVRSLINDLAVSKHLQFEKVTSKTAARVHRELFSSGGVELDRLAQGRLTPRFVYDFFSCVARKHLRGASLLNGKSPKAKDYKPGGNFYWSGIQIHIVRDTPINIGERGSIQGLCVFHDAYLSSYPGPTNFFHTVDPVLTKTAKPKRTSKNVGIEFNDTKPSSEPGQGSQRWCDIPILAGPGIGRLVLAHCIDTRCMGSERESDEKSDGKSGNRNGNGNDGNVNFFVSVAGGESNIRMLSLLLRFGFGQLHMTHPISREPWLDEAGDALFVLSRKGPVESNSAEKLLRIRNSEQDAPPSRKRVAHKKRRSRSRNQKS